MCIYMIIIYIYLHLSLSLYMYWDPGFVARDPGPGAGTRTSWVEPGSVGWHTCQWDLGQLARQSSPHGCKSSLSLSLAVYVPRQMLLVFCDGLHSWSGIRNHFKDYVCKHLPTFLGRGLLLCKLYVFLTKQMLLTFDYHSYGHVCKTCSNDPQLCKPVQTQRYEQLYPNAMQRS